MLLANDEAVMPILDTLNFVAFIPLQNNNSIAVMRRKLMAQIYEKFNLQLIRTALECNPNGLLIT